MTKVTFEISIPLEATSVATNALHIPFLNWSSFFILWLYCISACREIQGFPQISRKDFTLLELEMEFVKMMVGSLG